MLKNKFLFLILFLIISLSIPAKISAHVLKTDGSIGAVLHIDPDDDPIVNQPANFVLEFKDTKNKFHLYNCSCTYSLVKAGQTIVSGSLTSVSEDDHNSAAFSYTFPEKGVYQLKVSGSPVDNSFSNFDLDYDLRVSRDSAAPNFNLLTQSWHFLVLVGLLIVFLLIVFSGPIRKKLLK